MIYDSKMKKQLSDCVKVEIIECIREELSLPKTADRFKFKLKAAFLRVWYHDITPDLCEKLSSS